MKAYRMLPRAGLAPWSALVALIAIAAASPTAAEKRVALVIGNSAYQAPLPALPNPLRDAADIGRALEADGFETTVKTDVKRRELYQLIDAFAAKIAGSPDTVGLFYYAGHGLQTNGKNYLVPVDAVLRTKADLEAEAIDADKLRRAMDEAHNRINILILDSCRDDPLPDGRTVARGLARMAAPRGTFIGYAAAPGQTALDGEPGENGVFTGVLLKQLTVPGLQLENAFKRVIAGVDERSGGKQLPWMKSSVQGEFFFVPPGGAAVFPPPAPPATLPPAQAPSADTMTQAEMLFWQSVQQNPTVAGYEEYLKQFPNGRFAGLARLRIAALHAPPSSPAPLQPKPAPREVSRTSSLCGRVTEYSVAMPAGSGGFDEFIGAWSGNWSNRNGTCGALIVTNVYPNGRADIIYIFGPGNGAGPGLPWKRQQPTAAISNGTLSFHDDQGSLFNFSVTRGGSLEATFVNGPGRLRANFEIN